MAIRIPASAWRWGHRRTSGSRLEWASPQKIGGLVFYPARPLHALNERRGTERRQMGPRGACGTAGRETGGQFLRHVRADHDYGDSLGEHRQHQRGRSGLLRSRGLFRSEGRRAHREPRWMLPRRAMRPGECSERSRPTTAARESWGLRSTVSGTSPLGPWTRETVSKANGLWIVDLPLNPNRHDQRGGNSGRAQRPVIAGCDGYCPAAYAAADRRAFESRRHVGFSARPARRFPEQSGRAWPGSRSRCPPTMKWKVSPRRPTRPAYHKVVTIPAGMGRQAHPASGGGDLQLVRSVVERQDGLAVTTAGRLRSSSIYRTPRSPASPNDLCIRVNARSIAAMIDNMSVYAYFEIAGIWRPIELFCVEPVHVARLTYATTFDKQYKDADLAVDVKSRQ